MTVGIRLVPHARKCRGRGGVWCTLLPVSAPPVSPRSPFLVAITLLALVLGVFLGGCSGDDASDDGAPEPGEAAVQSSARGLPDGTRRTTVGVGEIAGRLSRRDRALVRDQVGRVVDRWWRAAWLAPDYPTTRIKAPFPGFTPAAERWARRDAGTMTAAGISRRIGGVVPRKRTVTVDVLAPGGRPAAATARFRLDLATWDRRLAERIGVMRVSGRLFLTPAGRRWQVFGFDVAEDRPRALLSKQKQQALDQKATRTKAGTRQDRGRR